MLEVLDDGPGFAKDFSLSTSKRFGLKFVEYVTSSELRGKATFSNRPEGGACVNITFPVTAGVL